MHESRVHITREEVVAENGVVAGGHEQEAKVGVQILEQGGNAIDAAVAAAFMAGVVEPWNCGIGGHGFASIYRADSGKTEVFNWLPKVPSCARPDMFELEEEGVEGAYNWPRVKGDLKTTGYMAASVPCTAGALAEVLKRHGTMPLDKVLEPAIKVAEEGYPVDWRTSYMISSNLEYMHRFPALGRIYTKNGLPPLAGTFYAQGDRLVLSDLAATLSRMAKEGTEFIYQGDVADKIVAEVSKNGGILTAEDLTDPVFQIESESPRFYRNITYITGVCPFIVEVLNILECFDLKSLGPGHPKYRHLMLEAMRQAWRDCYEYLGDPYSEESPMKGIQSKEYAQEVAQSINPNRAVPERRAGDPWKYEGRPRPKALPSGSWHESDDSQHTTQVVAIDAQGNTVSVVISLGYMFGSKAAISGTGIVLSGSFNSLDPRPGHLLSIVPGKRPWKFVPTTILFRGGKPYAAIAQSGARTTTSTALHIIVNLVDFGMGLQEAIEACRVHAVSRDAWVDNRLPVSTIAALSKMGHRVVPVRQSVAGGNFGRPSAVLIDPETGKRHAGGDPMLSAGAAGY